MSTELPDELKIERRIRSGGRRIGYLIAAAVDLVLLWVVHHLLEWGWPDFLTDDFEELLPIISVSLVAGTAANLIFAWDDRRVIKSLGDLVTSVLGLIGAIWTYRVFPFALSEGWAWLARTVIVVGIVGSGIGALNALARLTRPTSGAARTR